MIYISPNVGHAFFGIITLTLASIVLYDISTAPRKKSAGLAIDKLWGPVMGVGGIVYFVSLLLSLPPPT